MSLYGALYPQYQKTMYLCVRLGSTYVQIGLGLWYGVNIVLAQGKGAEEGSRGSY